VDVYQVPKAGHLLMLENWKDFETAFCMAAGGGDPEHDGGPMKVQPATSSDDNDDDHVQNAPVPHPLPPDHMVVGE
jgi:hypothetical protein